MTISESRSGEVCVLGFSGRIDSTNAAEVLTRLEQAVAARPRAVVVDLAEVRYLTSAAFRVLLVASEGAENGALGFALCNVVGQVRELFEMGGLLDAFVVHGSREEAVARLS